MARLRRASVWLGAFCAGLLTLPEAARSNGSLLPGPLDFFVQANGTNAYLTAHLNGLPSGHRLTNGAYRAWCVQFESSIGADVPYQADACDALSTNLPPDLATNAWNKALHVINHQRGDVFDIQNALWAVLGQDTEPPITASAQSMIDDATLFGSTFIPGPGQRCGVILQPLQPGVQRLLIEIACQTGCDPNTPFVPARLTAVGLDGSGKFLGLLSGNAGCTYRIEGSRDLVAWTPVQSVFNATGTVQFCDTNAPGFAYRFYRAVRE